MIVSVNGQDQDIGVDNLAALITALGFDDAVVATALNGAFVARTRRTGTVLQAGDRVEILAPMQGG